MHTSQQKLNRSLTNIKAIISNNNSHARITATQCRKKTDPSPTNVAKTVNKKTFVHTSQRLKAD